MVLPAEAELAEHAAIGSVHSDLVSMREPVAASR
jgi:hypothetical protein